MAKKKPQKQNIPSKRAKFGVGLSILLFLLAGIVMQFWYPNYKDKKRAEQIIADVRGLKNELENKFGVIFNETADCTQNQGKYDDENSSWGCSINIGNEGLGNDFEQQIEEVIALKPYYTSPFKYSDGNLGTGRKNTRGGSCGTYYNESSFTFRCSVQVNNANISQIKKHLKISE
ncbi:MAG: hypothetical protein M3Q79_03530 [bacterium]|nr:hypothetical protein [bacterium]